MKISAFWSLALVAAVGFQNTAHAGDAGLAKTCIHTWMQNNFGDEDSRIKIIEYLPLGGSHLGMGTFLAESLQTHLGRTHVVGLGAGDSRVLADALLFAVDAVRKSGDPAARELEKVTVYYFGLEAPHARLEAVADSAGMDFSVVIVDAASWTEVGARDCSGN